MHLWIKVNKSKLPTTRFFKFIFLVKEEKDLTDLERLARHEMIYSMSQLKNGQAETHSDRVRKIGRDETALAFQFKKTNKL